MKIKKMIGYISIYFVKTIIGAADSILDFTTAEKAGEIGCQSYVKVL